MYLKVFVVSFSGFKLRLAGPHVHFLVTLLSEIFYLNSSNIYSTKSQYAKFQNENCLILTGGFL
jgi:hypothetical protein